MYIFYADKGTSYQLIISRHKYFSDVIIFQIFTGLQQSCRNKIRKQ